ncbi:dipeptide ABC transporter ATP-binding protein [Streptomyces sp. NPDC057002]|uniref:dipeptide ABC transporter ATP-binding protein n=1 Tax=Streptomyces sp. NPDC057002 TaxID=3345992 RepID=UPI0036297B90
MASNAPDNDDALISAGNLTVGFGGREVVRGVSLTVRRGETVALVGESGSGKSVTARTLVGLTGAGARVTADGLTWQGEDVRGWGERRWRRVRGRGIGFVLQDALVSLDPLRPVGKEIEDALRLHGYGDRATRRARVLDVMTQVGVPDPELRAAQRPHELSGGLRQRALIAAALALDPPLLIADEPTTALDATVQAQILDLLAAARSRERGLLFITHDLGVVRRLADRVAVMRGGEIVEEGEAVAVLEDPRHPYTRNLLAADPARHPKGTRLMPGPAPADPQSPEDVHGSRPAEEAPGHARAPGPPGGAVLTADRLHKSFGGRDAVHDVSFALAAGRTLGIVGESGSGKSTTARIALGLTRPDAGTVTLHGEPWSELPERERRPRRHGIQLVYQDALSAFDPRWTVRRSLIDAVRLRRAGHPVATADEAARRVTELAAQVGLPEDTLDRHPLSLSGGQRQRAALARALAPHPSVLVLDEPVSALDVSVQAQVLDLLAELQESLGLAYLFISHDLGVVRHVSDDVLVMKDGRVVESGPADDLFSAPQHAYTRVLLDAVHPHPTATAGATR